MYILNENTIEDYNIEILDESAKTDFIAKFGQDTFNNFEKAKQRLVNNGLSVDYGQYLKKDKKEVDELILSLYDDKKDSQKKRVLKGEERQVRGEYKFFGEHGGYLIYQPLDYIASMDLGINTGWCTTGRYGHAGHPEYTPSEADAKKHFDDYKSTGIKLYYFLNPNTFYGEYAIAYYPRLIKVDDAEDRNIIYDSKNNRVIKLRVTRFEMFDSEDKNIWEEPKVLDLAENILHLNLYLSYDITDIKVDNNGFEIANNKLIKYWGNDTKIAIPSGVTSIGEEAFYECSKLTSVTIPPSVTSIGGWAFYGCSGLKSVYITDIAKWCGIAFEDIFSNPLLYAHNLYLNNTLVTELVIPNSITKIKSFAFSGCSSLASVTIGNNVTSIEREAFTKCTGLTSVVLSDNITSIECGAFCSCSELTSITIPESVLSIDEDAFYDCRKLMSVMIPKSVVSIGYGAFSECYNLVISTNNKYVIDYCRNDGIKCKILEKYLNEVYPNKGESKEDFISRFMSVTKDEYPDQKQRLAVAYSYWDRRKLKEEFLIDDSKIYTTQSPYEIKNKLIGSKLFYRIAYDKLLDRYFICDAYSEESIHISMIMKAAELGYYNKKISYDEAQQYIIKNVDCYRTIPSSKASASMLGIEGFNDIYEYNDFLIEIRDMSIFGGQKTDFTTTELYTVLGKYNLHRYSPYQASWGKIVEKYLKEEFIPIETRPFELEDILYWYNPEDGTCSAIIDYKKKKTRVRAGLLIIKNNKVLLCKNGAHFDLPGGSIEIGETIEEAAKREAQEEVNITAKNIRETGFDYCTTNDELEDWVAENVPEKYQWYNYYTCLCIGDYSGEFKGKVDAIDKDPEMKNSADWYDIDTIVDNPEFLEPWRNALTKFGYYNKTLTESLLKEDTRNTLINKSKNAGLYKDTSRGKNRFERKRLSKIANAVKEFNQINMDNFFKKDLLLINIPVIGETDSYKVSIKMDGVLKEIAKNIKLNGNKFEYKVILQALTKMFNTVNVYVNCTCDDYKYRFDHWNIVNNVSTNDSAHDPGPGKGIANPKDEDGRGCKHCLLILSNTDWIMKVTSVIHNYINWLDEHEPKLFAKLIFPKLYGMSEEDAVDNGLLPEDTKLETDKDILDKINEWAKNRGKYQPGSNKNPVTNTGGRAKKEEEKPKEGVK